MGRDIREPYIDDEGGDGPAWAGCPDDCDGCRCAALGRLAPCPHCEDNHADPDAGAA